MPKDSKPKRTGEKLKINEVKTSKLAIDDGVGSFKVSFNIKNKSIDDIVQILNRLADIDIFPYQQEAKFKDPNQGDIED